MFSQRASTSPCTCHRTVNGCPPDGRRDVVARDHHKIARELRSVARDHLQIEHTISLRGTSGAWLEITSRSTAASGAFPEEAEHVDKGNLYGEETHIICVCTVLPALAHVC